jgi:hypothetical protein
MGSGAAADDPAGGGAVSLTRIRARLVNFEEWRRRTSRDTGFPGEMEEGLFETQEHRPP